MKTKISALFILLPLATQAATVVNQTWLVGIQVPDNSPIGMSVTVPVTSSIAMITEVTVDLDLSGGWAGDLFCYIIHDSGFAVLLNRPGRSLSVLDGSGAVNLLMTLSDSGLYDIHTGIPVSDNVMGTFQPDGRNEDPDNTLDTDPRTAFLSSFNGLDANGEWTLFVADMAGGDTMTLNSWALNITGTPIPEPSAALLGMAGACLLLRRRKQA